MANDIVGFRFVIEDEHILKTYTDYLDSFDKHPPLSDYEKHLIFNRAETALGRLQGAKTRGGSKALVPDFDLDGSVLQRALYDVLGVNVSNAEAKLKRGDRVGTKIGSLSPDSALISGSIITRFKNIVKKDQNLDNIKDINLDNYTNILNVNGGEAIYNAIKKDRNLFNAFYAKAQFLQIFKKIDNTIEVSNLFFPISKFKVPPFKFAYIKNSKGFPRIALSLNDSFENQLLSNLQQIPPVIHAKNVEEFKDDLDTIALGVKGKKYKYPKFAFKLLFEVPTGGSIPLGGARVKYKPASEKTTSLEKTNQFISAAQLTLMARTKVQQNMRPLLFANQKASPPTMTYRSGRFVDSLKIASLDYKNSIIQYFYNPLYKRNEQFGYEVDTLIEGSLRETIASLYQKKFQLVRQTF